MEMRLHSESNGKEREKERIGVIFHGGHWADLFMSEVNWTGGNGSRSGVIMDWRRDCDSYLDWEPTSRKFGSICLLWVESSVCINPPF